MNLNAKPESTRLFFRGLKVMASVGILPNELAARQPLLLNIDVEVPRSAASSANDSIHEVFDYRVIHQQVMALVNARHFNLLETLADELLKALLQDPRVLAVRLELHKTQPYADAQSVGIEVCGARGRQ